MSHVATINLQFSDLDALGKAANDCGLELERDAKSFTYYMGQTAPCVHRLSLKNAPAGTGQIGIRYTDAQQRTYQPAYDSYGAGARLANACGGQELPKLKQRYAAHVSVAELRRKGYSPRIIDQEDGTVRVTASKY